MKYNLNEAKLSQYLQSNTKNKYTDIQLAHMLMFSPNWRDEWADANVELDFKDNDIAFDDAKDTLAKDGLKFDVAQSKQGLMSTSVKLPSKLQGQVMKSLVKVLPPKTNIRFKNGMMTVVGQEEVNRTAFNVAYAVANGEDPSTWSPDSAALEQAFQRATSELDSTSMSYKAVVHGDIREILKLAQANNWNVVSSVLSTNDSEIDNVTSEVFQFLDRMVSNGMSFDEAIADARKNKLASLLGMLQKKSLLDFKSATELRQFIEQQANGFLEESIPDPSSVANPLAKRRIKLFVDLKHEGGKVMSSSKWICGICYTQRQNHVFGRNKPLVNTDTGEIVDLANKRDDELQALVDKNQLSPEEMAKYISWRDRKAELPSNIKTISAGEYSNYSTETYWCTSGARSSADVHAWNVSDQQLNGIGFWYSYNWKLLSREKSTLDVSMECRNPYWVFMNLDTGVLFQYSRFVEGNKLVDYMMDEDDRTTDGVSRTSHGEYALLRHMRETFPEFKSFIDQVNPIGKEMLDMLDQLQFGDDGALVVSKMDSSIRAVLGSSLCPKKLRVDADDATNMFQHGMLGGVNVIDLTKVRIANGMFKYATMSRNLTIIGSKNVRSMVEMFSKSKGLVEVKGLDTSNAESIGYIFSEAQTKNDLALNIAGSFNLAKCVDISYAFRRSNISRIQFKNVGNVQDAKDFISECKMLKNIPEMLFPKIYSLYDVFTKFRSNQPSILGIMQFFFNNDAIRSGMPEDELQDVATKIYKFYIDDVPSRIQALVGEDGSLTVESPSMAKRVLRSETRFNTIRITFNENDSYDSTSPFEDIKLRCDVIDMSGVEDANSMFYHADLSEVKRIIGTESIVNAKYMFCQSAFPEDLQSPLDLRNAKYAEHVLQANNIKKWSKLPDIVLTPRLEDAVDSKSYLFGVNDWTAEVRFGDDAVAKWHHDKYMYPVLLAPLKDTFDSLTGTLKLKGGEKLVEARVLKINGQAIQFLGNDVNAIEVHGDQGTQSFKSVMTAVVLAAKCPIPPVKLVGVTDATCMFSKIKGRDYQNEFVSIGPITGFGSVKVAKEMFRGVNIQNESVSIDSFQSLVDGSSMFFDFQSRSAPLDVPLEFPALENGESMFESFWFKQGFTKSDVHITSRNFKNGKKMFRGVNSQLNLGDFKVVGAQTCFQMFNNAHSIDVNSIDIECENASEMFMYAKFVNPILKHVHLASNTINKTMYQVDGLQQIGELKVTHCSHGGGNQPIMAEQAFFNSGIGPNGLNTICFFDIDPNIEGQMFNDDFIEAYGCKTWPQFQEMMSVLKALQA